MQLRKDHIAGGVPLLAALGVLSLSRDLEIGTLASPGPGMLPHLAIVSMAEVPNSVNLKAYGVVSL